MSDASEVKVSISDVSDLYSSGEGDEFWVSAQDHDRIVAELKAGTANALKRVFNRQIGYMVSANAFRVLCEEIEKYDPFFKMPNSSERKRFVADRNAEMQKLKETVARQARVIEKLKLAVTDIANKNTCWRLYEIDKYKSYEDGWEGVAEFAGKVLNELEDVEQGDGT